MPLAPFAAVLALMLGTAEPLFVRQPPEACRRALGHLVDVDGDNGRTTVVVSDAERCLEVRITGRVTFDDADADVQSMDPGGALVVTESRGGEVRTLTLVERGGAIARAYRVTGFVRPADESASWFGGVVLALVREAGFGATERVARIRRQGGVQAVLDEVRHIRSDHVRELYLQALLAGSGLTAADVARVARAAADGLGSDHAKAAVLLDAVERRGDDRAVADEAVRGAATVGSDHERANVLAAVLDRNAAATPDARFFGALDAIGSDHERRRVLESLATRDSLGTESMRALLASTARLGSDHEKAAVLLAVVAWRPERLRDPAARAAFDAALKSLGSDAEYRRVASVFAVAAPDARPRARLRGR